MYLRLIGIAKVDREIDSKRHCFSPGGYTIQFEGGQEVTFDFEYTEATSMCQNDANIIYWRQKYYDNSYSSFSEEALAKLLRTQKIAGVLDFYIDVGEDDDFEPYEILEIESAQLEVYDNKGNYFCVDFTAMANARWQEQRAEWHDEEDDNE